MESMTESEQSTPIKKLPFLKFYLEQQEELIQRGCDIVQELDELHCAAYGVTLSEKQMCEEMDKLTVNATSAMQQMEQLFERQVLILNCLEAQCAALRRFI